MDFKFITCISPAIVWLFASVAHNLIDNQDENIGEKNAYKNGVTFYATMSLIYWVKELNCLTTVKLQDGDYTEVREVFMVMKTMLEESLPGFAVIFLFAWVLHSDVVEYCKYWWLQNAWDDQIRELRLVSVALAGIYFIFELKRQPGAYISDDTYNILFLVVLTFGHQAMFVFNPVSAILSVLYVIIRPSMTDYNKKYKAKGEAADWGMSAVKLSGGHTCLKILFMYYFLAPKGPTQCYLFMRHWDAPPDISGGIPSGLFQTALNTISNLM